MFTEALAAENGVQEQGRMAVTEAKGALFISQEVKKKLVRLVTHTRADM